MVIINCLLQDKTSPCKCPSGYHGDSCQNTCQCVHGYCGLNGSCVCDKGWKGTLCNTPCLNPGACVSVHHSNLYTDSDFFKDDSVYIFDVKNKIRLPKVFLTKCKIICQKIDIFKKQGDKTFGEVIFQKQEFFCFLWTMRNHFYL